MDNAKKIYHVSGTANVKAELIESLESYEKLFEKFQEVLEKDTKLRNIFGSSIINIQDAKKEILKDKIDLYVIDELLKIIKKHILRNK